MFDTFDDKAHIARVKCAEWKHVFYRGFHVSNFCFFHEKWFYLASERRINGQDEISMQPLFNAAFLGAYCWCCCMTCQDKQLRHRFVEFSVSYGRFNMIISNSPVWTVNANKAYCENEPIIPCSKEFKHTKHTCDCSLTY